MTAHFKCHFARHQQRLRSAGTRERDAIGCSIRRAGCDNNGPDIDIRERFELGFYVCRGSAWIAGDEFNRRAGRLPIER